MWYEGTADAIRKNLNHLLEHPAKYFVILSGDQLYSMDLSHMLEVAKQTDADLTIATIPVEEPEARRMGVMKVDSTFKIKEFTEKPNDPELLTKFAMDNRFLGSMGIYIFKRESLIRLLQEDPREDFGKHLIPSQLKKGNVYAYVFDGYWEDIGTIASYYNANINLTNNTGLDLYSDTRPIYTQNASLPAARLINTQVSESIICEGTIISAASIYKSMIGLKTFIDQESMIQNSVILGSSPRSNRPPTHVGKHCHLDKVILDEGSYLEDYVTLINANNLESFDSDKITVSEGIIVVKAGIRLPRGFRF